MTLNRPSVSRNMTDKGSPEGSCIDMGCKAIYIRTCHTCKCIAIVYKKVLSCRYMQEWDMMHAVRSPTEKSREFIFLVTSLYGLRAKE